LPHITKPRPVMIVHPTRFDSNCIFVSLIRTFKIHTIQVASRSLNSTNMKYILHNSVLHSVYQ